MTTSPATDPAVLEQVAAAVQTGNLTASAGENIRAWLTQPRYAEYVAEVESHIRDQEWQALDDVFWTVIPFGTGGRRGKMYPIGSNAINDRTIGESAQGLADYAKESLGDDAPLACAIAYDTRHKSTHFAQLCAEIMVANGFKVYFLNGFRSTPELSFAVRQKECSCGIMVTASHNPPSDNAVKVYWSTGGQVLPPHDQEIIERVMNTQDIARADFDQSLAAGKIEYCEVEVDSAYQEAVASLAGDGPRDLKVVYSPLHGVGTTAVCPVLEKCGFDQVDVFPPHADADPGFPNVPGNVSNPENSQVFDAIIDYARQQGADVAIASDPDCDRIGMAAPLTTSGDSRWETITGNQIGALLADYVLESWQTAGRLTPEHYIIETLVTTQFIRRIGDSYGVRTVGDLLVGFKWIAEVIDLQGPEHFVFGTEESHGYLAGTHVRDKDGAVGALLACELAAKLKSDGQTLHEKLDSLMWQHGTHVENTFSVQMPGSEGMDRMRKVMAAFRTAPPEDIGEMSVARRRDYLNQTVIPPNGQPQPLQGPQGDLIILDLTTEGNYVAVRPSGTEPKIKFYMFTYEPPEQLSDLDQAKAKLHDRLLAMEASLRKFARV